MPSPYYETPFEDKVRAGDHRNVIGGLWDELGQLQLDFLKKQGLQPHQVLMDVGCGSLRLGCQVVDYLEPGHYYGIDLSEALLDAGYNKELTDRQRERMPRSHLHATATFDFSYLADQKIDMAIAQSVFSHLPLNHVRDCLIKLAPMMKPEGVFYASFFLCPDHHDISQPLAHPPRNGSESGVTTYAIADPYHYRMEDMEYCTKNTPWHFQMMGDWQHPRNQQMASFILAA